MKWCQWALFVVSVLVFHVHLALGTVTIDRIVAVVDQEIITQSEMDASPLSSNPRRLTQIIESNVIAQTARRAGIAITPKQMEQALQEIERRNKFPDRESLRQAILAQPSSWEQYLSDLKMEMTAVALIQREIESDMFVTENAARDYYQQHLERFYQAEQIELRQILFPLPDDQEPASIESVRWMAEGVRREIENGASFDQMAERYNVGKKGEAPLLRLKKGDLVPGLEQIVFSLEINAVSHAIQTPAGFHLFKVIKKIAGEPQSFEEAYPAISSLLLQEKQGMLTRQWMGKLLKRTFIEVK